MRNITGSPVEGDDYFERPAELARLVRELENAANIRMNAARRVGKTSLVLRLCHEWRQLGKTAVFFNVEDTVDELSFIEKLLDELQGASLEPDAVTRCKLWIGEARKTLGISKLKTGAGLDFELGDVGEGQAATLGRAVESVFEKIEEGEQEILICIDEMPEVLLALSQVEGGQQRVSRLLHWLRALRQSYRKNVRWVFLGSIGLESFVEERLLGKTINDLTPFRLDALSVEDADRFLVALGESNDLAMEPELRAEIVRRVGWPLPHHLQIVFHALRDCEVLPLSEGVLDEAIETLLGPENLTLFDTWRQKLDEQFDDEESALAKVILNHLCQYPQGRGRSQILTAILQKRPAMDPELAEESLARLLQLLERDGYLIGQDGNYAFRSFLLRDYWHRRNVK